MALKGASKDITVNALCPSYFETDMVSAMSQDSIDKTVAQIPLGRLGSPEDIARCVHF